jgi:hypothetical protein
MAYANIIKIDVNISRMFVAHKDVGKAWLLDRNELNQKLVSIAISSDAQKGGYRLKNF